MEGKYDCTGFDRVEEGKAKKNSSKEREGVFKKVEEGEW